MKVQLGLSVHFDTQQLPTYLNGLDTDFVSEYTEFAEHFGNNFETTLEEYQNLHANISELETELQAVSNGADFETLDENGFDGSLGIALQSLGTMPRKLTDYETDIISRQQSARITTESMIKEISLKESEVLELRLYLNQKALTHTQTSSQI